MKGSALDNYQNGCNCAQAILKTFSQQLEIDDETAIKVASSKFIEYRWHYLASL